VAGGSHEDHQIEAEMMSNMLPSIFSLETNGKPMLTFEAKNLREAHELCQEQWLKIDLAEANRRRSFVERDSQAASADSAAQRERHICRGQK
jgi:hypothetical protein